LLCSLIYSLPSATVAAPSPALHSRSPRAAPRLQRPFFAGVRSGAPRHPWPGSADRDLTGGHGDLTARQGDLGHRWVIARRLRTPLVLPHRRRVAAPHPHAPPAWPHVGLVHGKDVHWPALKRDGFMLHHKEVNRGHHHRVHFGSLPSEDELMDLILL